MGFGLVIGFIGILQHVNTINYSVMANSRILQFTTVVLSHLSRLCFHQPLPGKGSQHCRFLNFSLHILTVQRQSHANPSWPQPLVIFSLLAVPVHNWLVLTDCRLTISTAKQLTAAPFKSPLYNLGEDRVENTAFNSSSIVCVSSPTIPRLLRQPLLPCKRVYRATV
jgi:hypothetical protein